MSTDTEPNARAATQRQGGHAGERASTRSGQGRSGQSRSGLGRELPRVPRRYGQWAAAVLLVLVSVLAAGSLWQQKSDRVEVLVSARAVPAGQVLTAGDLKVVDVAGLSDALGAGDTSRVIGSTAGVALVPGQVLTAEMITKVPVPGPGMRVVGVELNGTRAPAHLVPGDRVRVLAVPPDGDASTPTALASPMVLADPATVESVDRIEGSGTRYALLVPGEAADRVAAFGAAGRVSLVQAPLGGDD